MPEVFGPACGNELIRGDGRRRLPFPAFAVAQRERRGPERLLLLAAAGVFPDGRHAVGLTVPQFHSMVGPSYMPVGTNSTRTGVLLPNGSTLHDNSIIPYLAQDVTFTLDQLAALNLADPNGILTGKLDLQRVGIFGVSLGGIVAGEACRLDARLQGKS